MPNLKCLLGFHAPVDGKCQRCGKHLQPVQPPHNCSDFRATWELLGREHKYGHEGSPPDLHSGAAADRDIYGTSPSDPYTIETYRCNVCGREHNITVDGWV
jgi:hypothetical protein